MAADNEARLLSRAVRDRDIAPLIERGVNDEWFADPQHRAVWVFVRTHKAKYGEVPTSVTVKDNYPGYRLLKVEDSLEYLLDQMCSYRRRMSAIDIVQDAATVIQDDGDHESAIALMRKGLAQLDDVADGGSHDEDLTATVEQRLAEYEDLRSLRGRLRGLPTGFPTIDKATSGLQPGQLVTVIAPPKTGKSTLALQIASNIHDLTTYGGEPSAFVPCFTSFEMSNIEQRARHDAMRAHVNHKLLLEGALDKASRQRLERTLLAMEGMHPFHLTDSTTSMTVSGISAKIEKYQPDVMFIDGVYLMTDEQTGEQNTALALTNITRNLKREAQRAGIPIVISTQVLTWKVNKKKGLTGDSIGYSSSFFQDSDVILGLQRPEETDDVEDDARRQLRVVASRNCGPVQTDLRWDWEQGIFAEDAMEF